MFGLDDAIASHSDGGGLLIVALVAILLGLRHATDPDHLAAMTTLAPSEPGRSRAARLGMSWGAGHALTLFAFGLPIVLFNAFLPDRLQQGAETVVGLMIIGLAVWLIVRWQRGDFRAGSHAQRPDAAPGVPRRARPRRRRQRRRGSAPDRDDRLARLRGDRACVARDLYGPVDDAGDDGFRVGARAGTTRADRAGVGARRDRLRRLVRARRARARAVRFLVGRSRIRSRDARPREPLKRGFAALALRPYPARVRRRLDRRVAIELTRNAVDVLPGAGWSWLDLGRPLRVSSGSTSRRRTSVGNGIRYSGCARSRTRDTSAS